MSPSRVLCRFHLLHHICLAPRSTLHPTWYPVAFLFLRSLLVPPSFWLYARRISDGLLALVSWTTKERKKRLGRRQRARAKNCPKFSANESISSDRKYPAKLVIDSARRPTAVCAICVCGLAVLAGTLHRDSCGHDSRPPLKNTDNSTP